MAANESDLSPAARAVFLTISSSEVVCGVVGNVLLLLFLGTRYSLHTHTVHNLFIANLALTDLLTLGYWMVFFVLDLSLGYNPVVNESHCVVNGVIIAMSTAVSVLSLISISLNRYLHVCHAQFYLKVFSVRRTLLACMSCWVLGFLLSLPPLMGVGSYCYTPKSHVCSFCREGDHTYPRAVIGVFSVVPMCIIGYCNFSIFRFWKDTYSLNRKVPQFQKNSKRKVRHQQISWSTTQEVRQVTFESGDYSDIPRDDWLQVRDLKAVAMNQQGVRLQSDEVHTEIRNIGPRGQEDGSDDVEEDETHTQDSKERPHTGEDSGTAIASEDEAAAQQKAHARTNLQTDMKVTNRETESSEADQAESSLVMKEGEKDILEESTDILAEECSEGSSSTGLHRRHQLHLKLRLADDKTLRRRTVFKKNRKTYLQHIKHKKEKRKAKERAFVRSLFVVFLLFLWSFLPFAIVHGVDSDGNLPAEVLISADLLLFFSSAVNWIVYGVMNPSFRRGYRKLLSGMRGLRCQAADKRDQTYFSGSLSSLTTLSAHASRTH